MDHIRLIMDYIRDNPGADTQAIVDAIRVNRYIVEKATSMLVAEGLLREVGRTEWDDPKFELT